MNFLEITSGLRFHENKIIFGIFSKNKKKKKEINSQEEAKYSKQLTVLNEMGFTDTARNIIALNRSNGSIEEAISILASLKPSTNSIQNQSNESAALQATLSKAINTMHEMGFTNDVAIVQALKKSNGNIQNAAAALSEQFGQQQQIPNSSFQFPPSSSKPTITNSSFDYSSSSNVPSTSISPSTSTSVTTTQNVNKPISISNGFVLEPPAPAGNSRRHNAANRQQLTTSGSSNPLTSSGSLNDGSSSKPSQDLLTDFSSGNSDLFATDMGQGLSADQSHQNSKPSSQNSFGTIYLSFFFLIRNIDIYITDTYLLNNYFS